MRSVCVCVRACTRACTYACARAPGRSVRSIRVAPTCFCHLTPGLREVFVLTGHQKVLCRQVPLLSGVWIISELNQDKERPRNNNDRLLLYLYFLNCPKLAGVFFQVQRPRGPEATQWPEGRVRSPGPCPPRSKEALAQRKESVRSTAPDTVDSGPRSPGPLNHTHEQTHCPPLLRTHGGVWEAGAGTLTQDSSSSAQRGLILFPKGRAYFCDAKLSIG